MGRVTVVVLVALVVFGSILWAYRAASDRSGEDIFGKKTGEPVATGFLFVDWVYIDAPYIVSRRGADVFVNSTRVATIGAWRPGPEVSDDMPETPRGLTKQNTFRDLALPEPPGDSWDRKMMRWLNRHYEGEELRKRVVDYYSSLPFVTKVQWDTRSSDAIEVSTWDREKPLLIQVIGGGEKLPTLDDVVKELEYMRTRMEKRLSDGICIFLFSKGGELAFGAWKAEDDLLAIVRTLRSNASKKEKSTELQKLGLLPPDPPERWESLITNFAASQQLDDRAAVIHKPRQGQAPRRTLKEEQAAIEKMMKQRNEAQSRGARQ